MFSLYSQSLSCMARTDISVPSKDSLCRITQAVFGNQLLGSAVKELFLELVAHVHVNDPLSRERTFLTLAKCYLVVVRVPSKQCLWPLMATTVEAKSTQPTSTNTHLPLLLQITQRQQSYRLTRRTHANTKLTPLNP